jgi:hypothetical protein
MVQICTAFSCIVIGKEKHTMKTDNEIDEEDDELAQFLSLGKDTPGSFTLSTEKNEILIEFIRELIACGKSQ